MVKFRLCEEDRETYGGPEWVEFSVELLADQPSDFCEQIEDTLGWTVGDLGTQLIRASTRSLRAAIWIGRRIAGCDDDWASFKPKVWKAEQDDGEDDVPLADTGTSSSGDHDSGSGN